MTTFEALQTIMARRKVGVSQLARAMGKSPSTISERIHQENISIKKLDEMLFRLGYKIVLVRHNSPLPDGSITVQ